MSGGTLGRSSKKPKYKIEFHPEDSHFFPDDDQEAVVMPNKKGEKFLCFLPKGHNSKTSKLMRKPFGAYTVCTRSD
ncbi:PREDICTED: protein OS-9 homolog [Ipomoea nil]|uniref:protein OS-9 homolog n=1 Tax=Ipomoea nil TaxID=35883 RepID=UPI00090171AD|nr:PREDICTED: protein OS-9 homolog [Ipomoea nil]